MTIRNEDLRKFAVSKGKLDENTTLTIWDYVKPCRKEKCILAEDCPYWKQNPKSRACWVESQYLKSVMDPFLEMLEQNPDPFLVQWVGLHIIPLYHHLIVLQMEEKALFGGSRIYTDKGGKKNVHPIYREIRETIKAIRSEWKDSALYDLARKAGFFKFGQLKNANLEEILEGGAPGYYESMSGASDDGTS